MPRITWYFARFTIPVITLVLLFLSQRYWLRRGREMSSRLARAAARRWARTACTALLVLLVFIVVNDMLGRYAPLPRNRLLAEIAWLWFSSSMMAYVAIRAVHAVAWLWDRALPPRAARASASDEAPVDLARRRFVQTAAVVAGAAPFAGFAYGFAVERWQFQVREQELALETLPPELDGLRIAQLSDLHIGSFMPAREIRRAVGMANDLRADLTVVSGDFLTEAGDPLEACIAELARLRAPLGVWGCNGNHEIYAGVEALAADLFSRYGMKLLRQERAEIRSNGRALHLIGVDYQRERNPNGTKRRALTAIESLVDPNMFHILMSHNPNSFERAAELGIDLSLAGHTHGGQIRVEILDADISPARFFTPYIAGLYRRPLFASSSDTDFDLRTGAATNLPQAIPTPSAGSLLYVNRGLGTIGAPVRLGVPPEITLHTLRRSV
ncbi:MAG: metallophosphoesterase [Candidatus Acidiferrales bacterium]